MTIYYDDLHEGWSEEYGEHTMTQDGIIAFAEQFDPQPMHTDPEAAAETVHGGVIASGVHTIGIATRLMVENFLNESANIGGLGIDDLRFHEAVYPGDTLSARHEVVDVRVSESNPDTGIVTREIEVKRDDGTVVVSWLVTILLGRDPDR